MFRKILVPVDLTEKTMAALDVASELAKQAGGSVSLLHVIETIEHLTFDEMKDLYKRLEHSARKRLKEFSDRVASQGSEVDSAVIYGHRTQEIVKSAIEKQTDLIIMASHRIEPDRPGHGWVTISHGVAVLAPCAVLLVK